MFSTPGLTAGRLAPRGDHASKPGSIVFRPAPRSHTVATLSARSAVDRDDTGRGKQLAPLAAGSDPAGLERLYRQEASGLARIIARRTDDPELVRDFVHDAFVRIAGRPGALALLDRPQAYLRRIAANLIRDRSRTDVRRSARLHVAAEDDVLPVCEPHALLEARDMLRRVEAAMLRLPDRTREIFMAHRVEGLTYAEIAERTGLTVKGVEKQMSKALARLDRLVARD